MGACMTGGQGDVYDFGGMLGVTPRFWIRQVGSFPADLYKNAFVKRRVASGMCVCLLSQAGKGVAAHLLVVIVVDVFSSRHVTADHWRFI